ncbi:site-specific integrase [Flavobacterium sp. Sd200]|nr:site-specific integrase [Flavobacterium sp. Sd200]
MYLNFADFDSLRARRKAVRIAVENLERILESGYNPYDEKSAEKARIKNSKVIALNKTVEEAITIGLNIAEKTLSTTSYPDHKSRVLQFKKYLIEEGFENAPMSTIDVVTIVDFLNQVLERSSARNRNNTRTGLSSLYATLKANFIVQENIVEEINILKATPTKNKTFTTDQEEKVLDLLRKKDPQLHLFVKFISLNFLRPIEVVRLTVRDISVTDKTLRVKAKNQPVKVKIIPKILLDDLPDFENHKLDDFIFKNMSGIADGTDINRRNYFSERFKKIKDELDLGKDYGLYSFRHTYITKLYREIRKTYSPFEAKSRLMLITGHTSMKALDSYLRDIDAELPEDYSALLKKKKQ